MSSSPPYEGHLFVSRIDASASSQLALASALRSVRSVIDLVGNLGLRVVEDGATVERLDSLGCDCAQGYLFSRPLDPAALAALLQMKAKF